MSESRPHPPQLEGSRPKPAVRVGIVTRDRVAALRKAIQSALSQDYNRAHVAVLDDGSVDGASAIAPDFPSVHWRRWERPRGILEARNELMRTTDADYYLSLDDDAWFVNGDEIAAAIDYLEANPNVAALAFDILSSDRPDSRPRSTPCPIHMFIGCGHVLRMSAVAPAGFYTPSPGTYGSEEKDLCVRLLDRGWDVRLFPGVHVWHDKTATARDGFAQYQSGVCNDLAFALRRSPLYIVLAMLPMKILAHIRFSLGHRLLRPCLAGIGLFSRTALATWRVRQPVRTRTLFEFARRSRTAV